MSRQENLIMSEFLIPKNGQLIFMLVTLKICHRGIRRRGIITNIVQKANFSEGNYGELNLKKGRYWLWSSSNDVVIYSCEEGGVSDPKPVWR